jgi:Protein of unknown function (DUF3558)
MTQWKLFGLVAGWGAIVLAACGGSPGATEEPQNAAPTSPPAQPTEAAPQPTSPPPSGPGLDVDTINLCDVLPPAEFASLAGGTPYSELTSPGPSCSYVIDPGDGTAASYHTFLYKAETMRPVMDYVRGYESADWIEGYGDSAYIQDAASGDGYVLMILVAGQYGFEVGGPDKGVLQATARVIMERVGP